MHLPALTIITLTLLLSPTTAITTPNGYWNLELLDRSSPSSYSLKSTRSEYFNPSGQLANTVYCADEHMPSYASRPGDFHTPCNDTSFACTKLGFDIYSNTYLYEIKQTVELEGERVPLVGTGNLSMRVDQVTGFSFFGSVKIDATLAGK